MEHRKLKKIIAIILILLAFLLSTIIISSSIINSFHLIDNEHTPMISYETYSLSTNRNYTPTSGDSYTVDSKQNSSASENVFNPNSNSDASIILEHLSSSSDLISRLIIKF